jgi:UDP-glucose 4-epimerase
VQTVLITGGTGYIAGRLIEHLRAAGRTRIRVASRRAHYRADGVDAMIADASDEASLQRACDGVDVVVNLSGMSEADCELDPLAAMRVNGGGTLAWVTFSECAGVGRFVQVSTSKVYGSNLRGTVTEETACRPQSHYAITHLLAENYVSLHRSGVVIRLGNGFGAPAGATANGWSGIVNDFCRQAAVARQITIRSSGTSWRNFVPMTDVVQGLSLAMELPAGTYQLGAARAMTLRDAADLVAQVCHETLGFRPGVECMTPPAFEREVPLDYRIGRMMAAGFQPAARFETEIAATLRAASASFRERSVSVDS